MYDSTLRRLFKPAVAAAVLAVAALPWFLVLSADGGSGGACRHNCRCSRLEYFDRLLPNTLPGHSGDALGEVQRTVGLLLADPATDWSEIRLSRLRQRLADLNEITMNARVEEREAPGGLDVSVGGDEGTLESLRRIVPEHVRRMDGFRGWEVNLEDDAGETLGISIRADDAAEVEVVRGLGFFGFLASGVHRPQNNLAVVRGRDTAP